MCLSCWRIILKCIRNLYSNMFVSHCHVGISSFAVSSSSSFVVVVLGFVVVLFSSVISSSSSYIRKQYQRYLSISNLFYIDVTHIIMWRCRSLVHLHEDNIDSRVKIPLIDLSVYNLIYILSSDPNPYPRLILCTISSCGPHTSRTYFMTYIITLCAW